jgi:hypothetical protein
MGAILGGSEFVVSLRYSRYKSFHRIGDRIYWIVQLRIRSIINHERKPLLSKNLSVSSFVKGLEIQDNISIGTSNEAKPNGVLGGMN